MEVFTALALKHAQKFHVFCPNSAERVHYLFLLYEIAIYGRDLMVNLTIMISN